MRLFFRIIFVLVFAVPLYADPIRVVRREVKIDGWLKEHHGLKIAFFADTHLLESNIREEPFSALPALLAKEKPDLILLGGDTVDTPARMRELEGLFVNWVAAFPATPCGIYAVLGNHDLNMKKQVLAMLKKAKINVLCDSGTEIMFNGKPFRLLGSMEENNEKAYIHPPFLELVKKSTPCIVVTHRPVSFRFLPSDQPMLILAGHTHGGVVHVPGLPRGTVMRLFTKDHDTEFVYGWFEKDKKKMFITGGMGGNGKSSMRFGNPPELVIVTMMYEPAEEK